jgi:hypothetical protein
MRNRIRIYLGKRQDGIDQRVPESDLWKILGFNGTRGGMERFPKGKPSLRARFSVFRRIIHGSNILQPASERDEAGTPFYSRNEIEKKSRFSGVLFKHAGLARLTAIKAENWLFDKARVLASFIVLAPAIQSCENSNGLE